MVSGHADPGSLVTVNGFVVPLQGDRFSRNVSLSGGDNVIVVRAEDGAGNSVERRFSVALTPPPRSAAVGIGLALAGIVVAGLIAFILGRRFLFGAPPPEGSEPSGGGGGVEASPVVVVPEELRGTPEAPAGTEEPTPHPVEPEGEPELDEYDAALEDLESFEAEDSGASATEDPRMTKLRETFESGKITREVYEANLKRLGKGS